MLHDNAARRDINKIARRDRTQNLLSPLKLALQHYRTSIILKLCKKFFKIIQKLQKWNVVLHLREMTTVVVKKNNKCLVKLKPHLL